MNLKSPTAVEKCRKERKRAHILSSSSSSSSSSAFKSTKAISDRTRQTARTALKKNVCYYINVRASEASMGHSKVLKNISLWDSHEQLNIANNLLLYFLPLKMIDLFVITLLYGFN